MSNLTVLFIICGCTVYNGDQVNITLYTSVDHDDITQFYNDLHNPYAFYTCDQSKTRQVNVVLGSDVQLVERSNIISRENKESQVSNMDYLFALNSISAAEKVKITGDHKKYFSDENSLLSSLSELICNGEEINNVLIYFNYEPQTKSTDSTEKYNIQVPQFDPSLLDVMAAETFYKFTEVQNLLANEKNTNLTDEIISNALRIFVSDQASVEIQNKSHGTPITLSIRDYLHRLYGLNQYDRVHIAWNHDIKMTESWQLSRSEIPASYNIISGRQTFKGYKKNMVLYSDEVDKTIELHALLVENIDMTGNLVLEWKVFLGDIKVSSDSHTTFKDHT